MGVATKVIAIFLAIVLFVVIVLSYQEDNKKVYLVELQYCDARPKEQVYVTVHPIESVTYIQTVQRAVPEYYGHLNVCKVTVIREIK
jgi:hypothetical protein